jgi:hypothetical protein
MENGTCATIVALFQMNVEDFNLVELERRFSIVPKLEFSDILCTEDEDSLLWGLSALWMSDSCCSSDCNPIWRPFTASILKGPTSHGAVKWVLN